MTTALPLRVFALGIPKGQPRPKAFARGKHAGVYDPGTANEWKGAVARAFEGHHGLSITDAVSVTIDLHLPRPKGHFRTDGVTLTKSAPVHHTGKPDLDNAAKAILDAMTDFQFWKDDSACVELIVRKRWTATKPGALIEVNAVPDLAGLLGIQTEQGALL